LTETDQTEIETDVPFCPPCRPPCQLDYPINQNHQHQHETPYTLQPKTTSGKDERERESEKESAVPCPSQLSPILSFSIPFIPWLASTLLVDPLTISSTHFPQHSSTSHMHSPLAMSPCMEVRKAEKGKAYSLQARFFPFSFFLSPGPLVTFREVGHQRPSDSPSLARLSPSLILSSFSILVPLVFFLY